MTGYEAAARQTKAEKMARVLLAHGATSDDVAALPPRGRRMVAELAGTRLPSQTTWDLVVDIVRAWHIIQPREVA